MILNIFITFLLVFLNGFFVAAEFAIVKIRYSQVELRERAGSKMAKLVRHLLDHLDAMLSATQLGITLASLGLGWIGESVVSDIIFDIFHYLNFDLSLETAHSVALPIAFITITALHIIFGELAPKSIAIQKPETVAFAVSLPLNIFYTIFKPFILFLNACSNLLLKILRIAPTSEKDIHSPEELRYLIEESAESGLIESEEHEIIENVFEFSDTPVKQIMAPRNKIIGVEKSMQFDEIVEKFVNEGYSRMPVYLNTIDNIQGFINAKDLLSLSRFSKEKKIKNILRPALFVSEEEKIDDVLKILKKNKVHIAFALDEFGGVSGLITMEDIIEELIGEIQDEYDEESPIADKISEYEYNVKATASISDLNELLPYPLDESDDYETLAGLLTSIEGRVPLVKEIVELPFYKCTIISGNRRAIESVKLVYLPENEVNEA